MSQQRDEGFIGIYVSKISQLQVRDQLGEDVSAKLAKLVEEAKSRSKVVEGSSGADNLPGIRGRLKVMAHTAAMPEEKLPNKLDDGSAQRRADFFLKAVSALGG